jgi:hypothetical protein
MDRVSRERLMASIHAIMSFPGRTSVRSDDSGWFVGHSDTGNELETSFCSQCLNPIYKGVTWLIYAGRKQ